MACVVLLLTVALGGFAYLVPASAQAPAGVTVFEGARLIVGDGRAAIENATFVVEGGRSQAEDGKGLLRAGLDACAHGVRDPRHRRRVRRADQSAP
jgi:hypothetical protein